MMLTEHRLTIEAKCPVDDTTDTYNVYVRTTSLMGIEEIKAVVAGVTTEPLYQEDLTRNLGEQLIDVTEVETHGIHSGVYTTCRYTA